MKAVVVIPAYKERDNLSQLLPLILNSKINPSIVVVDDNSQDGTRELLSSFSPRVFAIYREEKLGVGSAFLAGAQFAVDRLKPDVVIGMDADLSHDPSLLPILLDKINRGGFDVVIGSRYIAGGGINGWGPYRRAVSLGANALTRLMLQLKPHDCTSGFRAYSSRAIKKILSGGITSNGYSFLLEILFRLQKAGLALVEVPMIFNDRTAGSSKLSKKEILKYFLKILELKFRP